MSLGYQAIVKIGGHTYAVQNPLDGVWLSINEPSVERWMRAETMQHIERFEMSPQLVRIFENTVKLIEGE